MGASGGSAPAGQVAIERRLDLRRIDALEEALGGGQDAFRDPVELFLVAGDVWVGDDLRLRLRQRLLVAR
jgi:hypothetical protein